MNDKLENAYYNIEKFVLEHCSTDEWNEFVEYIELVQKAVRALEIIKNKGMLTTFLISCLKSNDLEGYNKIMKHKLTQEEFDLLKEVLL